MTKYVILRGRYGATDSLDFLIPRDATGNALWLGLRGSLYDQYAAVNPSWARNSASLRALTLANNPELTAPYTYTNGTAASGGRQFGMPFELEGMHGLYEAGDAAIIANQGLLIEPVTAAEVEARPRVKQIPGGLRAHNSMQLGVLAGTPAPFGSGWIGRLRDNLHRKNSVVVENRRFDALGMGVGSTFPLLGVEAQPFFVGPDAAPTQVDANINSAVSASAAADVIGIGIGDYNHLGSGGVAKPAFANECAAYDIIQGVQQRSFSLTQQYLAALAVNVDDPVTPGTPYNPDIKGATDTASRYQNILKAIAIIEAGTLLGTMDTVFFEISDGGHDDHSDQTANYNNRLSVADKMEYLRSVADADISFVEELIRIGVWSNTVVVEWSDFGRTITPNSPGDPTSGTDHGWGGNAFVYGGPVIGQKIYHAGIPDPDLSHPQIYNSRGIWVPTLATEQYLAAIGLWVGLTEDELKYGVGGTQSAPTFDAPFGRLDNYNNYPGTTSKIVPWVNLA